MAQRRFQVVPGGKRDPRQDGALCDLCPLKHSTPVFGEGALTAEIAVVGEAPGREEVKEARPFIGKSGAKLEADLEHIGSARSRVWIDNAIACFPPGGDLDDFIKRSKKEAKDDADALGDSTFHHPVDCCRPRLFKALRIPKCKKCGKWEAGPAEIICLCHQPLWVKPAGGPGPTVVIAAGNAALESLTGVGGITKWRGSPIDMKRWGRKFQEAALVLPTTDPNDL